MDVQIHVGQFCVVRSSDAGVFCGTVGGVATNPTGTHNVTFTAHRQLHRWWPKEGQGVAAIAASGMADRSEVLPGVWSDGAHTVAGCCQIIECGADVAAQLQALKPRR